MIWVTIVVGHSCYDVTNRFIVVYQLEGTCSAVGLLTVLVFRYQQNEYFP